MFRNNAHSQAVLAYGTAYCVFMWAWWGATGEWVYASLDWSKPASLGAYVALPVLLVSRGDARPRLERMQAFLGDGIRPCCP
jgi:hypothetical protein